MLLFISLAFRKYKKACNVLNITLVLNFCPRKTKITQSIPIELRLKFIDSNSDSGVIVLVISLDLELVRFCNSSFGYSLYYTPFDQITITKCLQQIKPRKIRCKKSINYNEEKVKIL